jgi:hypothetical protein
MCHAFPAADTRYKQEMTSSARNTIARDKGSGHALQAGDDGGGMGRQWEGTVWPIWPNLEQQMPLQGIVGHATVLAKMRTASRWHSSVTWVGKNASRGAPQPKCRIFGCCSSGAAPSRVGRLAPHLTAAQYILRPTLQRRNQRGCKVAIRETKGVHRSGQMSQDAMALESKGKKGRNGVGVKEAGWTCCQGGRLAERT